MKLQPQYHPTNVYNTVLTSKDAISYPGISLILTQYNVKILLRVIGGSGDEAVRKELQQLHDNISMEPRLPAILCQLEIRDELEYLMILKNEIWPYHRT